MVIYQNIPLAQVPWQAPPNGWKAALMRARSLGEGPMNATDHFGITFIIKLMLLNAVGSLLIVTAMRSRHERCAAWIRRHGWRRAFTAVYAITLGLASISILIVNFTWTIWMKVVDIHAANRSWTVLTPDNARVVHGDFASGTPVVIGPAAHLGMLIGGGIFYFLLSWWTVGLLVKRSNRLAGSCKRCGYPITTENFAICPECGPVIEKRAAFGFRMTHSFTAMVFALAFILLCSPLWLAWIGLVISEHWQQILGF